MGCPADEILQRHGPGDAVALRLQTPQLQQHLPLFDGFHPLGNHPVAERAGQADHTLHDGQVAGVAHHAVHKALVDLERVHGQAAQVGQ